MGNEVNDVFRDTHLRYLGYANEVGEAFRPVVPRALVRFSYKIAFLYVFADTADKGLRSLWKEKSPTKVLIATGDALLWQTLASVIVPGFTINRISAFSHRKLCSIQKLPKMACNTMAVAIGLVCIPIIVGPIDAGVTVFMDITYRKLFGHH